MHHPYGVLSLARACSERGFCEGGTLKGGSVKGVSWTPTPPAPSVNKWAVRILLECIVVLSWICKDYDFYWRYIRNFSLQIAVADLGGRTRRAKYSPLRPKIFSISCSFSQNLAKSYVGAPPEGWRPLLRGILDPPLNWSVANVRILPKLYSRIRHPQHFNNTS